MNVKEGQAMVAAAKKAKKVFVIGFQHRFQAITGHIGKISFVNLSLAPGATPETVKALRRTIEAGPGSFRAFDASEVGQTNIAVQAGSLSAAASRTGVPLPTLSRRMRELEKQLNVQLLERSVRGTKLTDAGVRLYEHASRGIDQALHHRAFVEDGHDDRDVERPLLAAHGRSEASASRT
jgi:molybdenum-dependent DNA-binding transcriptional regulator ModE